VGVGGPPFQNSKHATARAQLSIGSATFTYYKLVVYNAVNPYSLRGRSSHRITADML